MSMLPQVEQALVDAAERYHRRRRRARRAVVTAAAAGAVTVVAGVALVALPGDAEREVAAGQPPMPTAGDPAALAREAGCELRHPRPGSSEHEAGPFRPGHYGSNPPVGGDHPPEVAPDGIHPPGRTPDLGRLVHSLEHGRIHLQYRPGVPRELVEDLKDLFAETGGHHLLLFENATGMESRVVLTAWGHSLACDGAGAAALDAMRAFRDAYVDKGPELVP